MQNDWETKALGEIAEELRARTGDPDGLGLPVYGVDRSEGLTSVPKYQSRNLSRYKKIMPGEFAYNPMRLNIGSIAMCPLDSSPGIVSPDYIVFAPCEGHLDSRFMDYFRRSPIWMEFVSRSGTGSVRERIYLRELSLLQATFPSLCEQRAIAEILGALDDKIELNRKMNATLDELARTIFRSWFVDFDPVRAKAEGREPLGMDAETAALFPDRFNESELGPIPDGWEVKPLNRVADFLNGLALQKHPPANDSYDLPVIKIAQLRKNSTEGAGKAGSNVPEKYVIEDGDILFSWSGTLEAIIWGDGLGALNQHLFKVTSKEYPKWFYFQAVHQHLDEFRAIAADKATTMGHIQRRHLSEALVAVPPAELLNATSSVLKPLLDFTINNLLESRTLAELRDTLLPELISGRIRVPNTSRVDHTSAMPGRV